MVKINKIGLFTFIRSSSIPERLHYRHYACDDLATLFINLVNFGSVTPALTKVKGVHPLVVYNSIQ